MNGTIYSVRKQDGPVPSLPLAIPKKVSAVGVVFNLDEEKLFLDERLPDQTLVRFQSSDRFPEYPKVVSAIERRQDRLDRISSLPPKIQEILQGIHHQEVVFPKFELRRQESEGTVLIEFDPKIFKVNAEYAQEALRMAVSSTEMTMSFGPAMLKLSPLEFYRKTPPPEIFISVARNGAFVGFQYQMPTEFSARGTVREIGTPSMGTLARIVYEEYLQNASFPKRLLVPVDFNWQKSPSRIQKASVTHWMNQGHFQAIRNGWIKI
jgi:hypothetical protein